MKSRKAPANDCPRALDQNGKTGPAAISARAQNSTSPLRIISCGLAVCARTRAIAWAMPAFSAQIPNESLRTPRERGHLLAGAVEAAASGQHGIAGKPYGSAVGEQRGDGGYAVGIVR